MNVQIPNEWDPRDYQFPLWDYFEDGGKRAAAVWHRRAGKDSTALNLTAVKSLQRVGVYWHMLPTATQGRKVIWDGIDKYGRRLIDQAIPKAIRKATNNTEMKIELLNGSLWQVVGSDNYDNLVGPNPVGIVFSEYAVADPKAWDYLRPILAENGGWALFIYTARGRNHGAKLFEMAEQNPNWFAEKLTVDDTDVLGPEIIAEERASGMDENMIQQEYYCSFDAAMVGAYYGDQMGKAETEDRIREVPYDKSLRVHTAWDLGIGDSTSIWFLQTAGSEVRVIDYYEASGVGLDHYVKMLEDKDYIYDRHILPHDVRVRELGTGKSRLEVLANLGVTAEIAPDLRVEDGIEQVRVMLDRCWFDRTKCARGIDALRQYRREYDDRLHDYRKSPLHDWTSHAADAFRYFAVGYRPAAEGGGKLKYRKRSIA